MNGKHASTPLSPAPLTVPLAEGPVRPFVDRAIALLFAGAGTVCYGALVRIAPDARGHGTHEQLGMEACGWPLQYGIPCPTCGCTTAACLVVHGRILSAVQTQPFGAAFAAVGLLVAAIWFLVVYLRMLRELAEAMTHAPRDASVTASAP